MEVVGRLTGGIIHDFNNILTVIAGTIDILADAVADRPELAAVAGLIAEATTRGANLTSHLLAFARAQPSQPREVDINALIVEATRLLRPTLGEQIELDMALAPDLAPAWADTHQLMTLLLNLAILARDAMPDGGKLTFGTGEVPACERQGHEEAASVGHVRITIHACSHDIADHDQGRAFLDLGLVQDCIKRYDIHLSVRTDAGRGTRIEFELPKATLRAASQEQRRPVAEGGAEAILIVEDDALVRKYVVSQLRSLGYRTLAASNADEALSIIGADEDIDILFTDVMMPGPINGRQLAIEAMRRRPQLKILYTSGYAEQSLHRERRLDPDSLLLAKPYRKVDLARMIRAALAA